VTIAVSMGDPAGVGPEIILKAFREGEVNEGFVVVGDQEVLEACREAIGLDVPIRSSLGQSDLKAGVVNVITVGAIRRSEVIPGEVSRACGAAAMRYIEAGVRLAREGSAAALVTLPVNKEAVRLSAPGFSGHTGFIADLCRARGVAMMLYSPKLAVSHVSAHLSLREAIEAVRPQRIGEVIELTASFLSRLGRARLAVAGLNPHAGEAGAFGSSRHGLRPGLPRGVRRGRLHVSRPGPHPDEAPGFRGSGERDPGIADRPDIGGPRDGVRHRVEGPGVDEELHGGDRAGPQTGWRRYVSDVRELVHIYQQVCCLSEFR